MRAAASELGQISPADALSICLVLLRAEPARYVRAAARLQARLMLDVPRIELAEAQLVLAAFEGLRSANPAPGGDALVELGLPVAMEQERTLSAAAPRPITCKAGRKRQSAETAGSLLLVVQRERLSGRRGDACIGARKGVWLVPSGSGHLALAGGDDRRVVDAGVPEVSAADQRTQMRSSMK